MNGAVSSRALMRRRITAAARLVGRLRSATNSPAAAWARAWHQHSRRTAQQRGHRAHKGGKGKRKRKREREVGCPARRPGQTHGSNVRGWVCPGLLRGLRVAALARVRVMHAQARQAGAAIARPPLCHVAAVAPAAVPTVGAVTATAAIAAVAAAAAAAAVAAAATTRPLPAAAETGPAGLSCRRTPVARRHVDAAAPAAASAIGVPHALTAAAAAAIAAAAIAVAEAVE